MEVALAAAAPVSAAEEATKRNTDCVYFLASPLTCKKGNDCEYRHSEGARMNPRDCWYWLNGNCLNAKCSFRHPPLDGLLGLSGPGEPSLHSSHVAPAVQMTAFSHTGLTAHNQSKQSVSCFYFQKGHCLKADRCPFLHGPLPAAELVPAQPQPSKTNAANPVHGPPLSLTKMAGTLEKCTSGQKVFLANSVKHAETPPSKSALGTEDEIIPSNGLLPKSNANLNLINKENPLPKRSSTLINGSGGRLHTRPSHQLEEHYYQNNKEGDEFLGESSPGFDVLVDDELEDSNYYPDGDDLGRNPDSEVRDFGELEYNASSEAKFNDLSDYDRYGRARSQHGWDPRYRSTERNLERSSISAMERRSTLKHGTTDQIHHTDLRHKLSKRRTDSSRSPSSPDRHGAVYQRGERFVEKRMYVSHTRRDQWYFPHERSTSSRLQGRLKLPERPREGHSGQLYSNRELERGTNGGRMSPGRSIPLSSYQGRHQQDRTRRMQDDLATGLSSRGTSIRRDEEDSPDFEGPKSLAELKRGKVDAESSFSFEGPKPTSAILKRKREAAAENGADSASRNESNQRQRLESFLGSKIGATGAFGRDEETQIASSMTDAAKESEEGMISNEDGDFVREGQSSDQKGDAGDAENESLLIENNTEDQEYEASERDGKYDDYEPNEGEDFKAANENADAEDEYLDDEDGDGDGDGDGDDFARKVGAMMS